MVYSEGGEGAVGNGEWEGVVDSDSIVREGGGNGCLLYEMKMTMTMISLPSSSSLASWRPVCHVVLLTY